MTEAIQRSRRSEIQKMLAGELYDPTDTEIQVAQARNFAWMERYNTAHNLPADARLRMLREGIGHAGDRVTIRAPFFCDFGFNIRTGDGVFLNFNCVILDVMPVTIGDGTLIGPGVHIYAADHPRDAAVRRRGLEHAKPVVIGRNVWIGGGAIILPGVTIGDDAIVGAGSVVTRDVAAGMTVRGNPAR